MERLPDTVPARTSSGDGASDARRRLAEALGSVGRGDRAAFEEVYRRTAAKLFGVCLRILPTHSLAEEALQDAYLTIWQRAGSFDEARGSAMTWLLALTRNRAIDRLRAGGKGVNAAIEDGHDIADATPDAFAQLDAQEDERRLASCIDMLSDDDAYCIRGAFQMGMTYQRLADEAALPLGTVKSRIRRALLKLRECLQ